MLGGCLHPVPGPPPQPLRRDAYARYLSGKLAGYRGDWAAAADALAEAFVAAPDQPMIAIELARALMKAKRAEAALDTLASARARWPDHSQVWLVSGDFLATGDPAAATAAYLRAIRLLPDDEHAYLGLAKLQRDDAALDTLRTLLAHVPGSVDGRYALAVRLASRGALAAAATELRAVLERDPDHIDARIDLGRALRRQGRLDQAIAETRSAFDRSGQALDIAEELFWLLCESDNRAAAIDLLTLLDDDHSDADALAVIARLDRGLGRIAEARAVAQRIAQFDREAGAIALAETQLAAGNRAAVATTVAAISQDGRFAEAAHRLVAQAALDAGDPAAALAALAPASESRPSARDRAADAATPRTGAGRTSASRPGDPQSSGRPRSIESALIAAFALADLGRLGDAQAMLAGFGTATNPSGQSPNGSPVPGREPTTSGEAARTSEGSWRADNPPDQASGVIARARLAERTGDAAAALALLDPLIRSKPDMVAALNLAGYLLADTRQRLGDAERYLRHARELSPGDPAILDSWGWLLLHRGEPRAAVRALDHAARFAPLEPEILAHLAAAWAADGAPRTAADVLARAAALAPPPAVQKRIAAIRQTLARGDTMGR